MIRSTWQHFKRPNGKWDAQAVSRGRVVGTTAGQGHNREITCLNAVESMSGSRESKLVAFADRTRSPRVRK